MMESRELLELYQLLRMYRFAYGDEDGKLTALLSEIASEYAALTSGKDIEQAKNPRGAGRKRRYSAEQDEEILKIYKGSRNYRKAAEEAGCSIGHIQDVVNKWRAGC